MRALIIGGSGAIGSAVARYACAAGIETHTVLRKTSLAVRLEVASNVQRHVADVADAEAMAGLIRRVQPDWIAMAAFPMQGHAVTGKARRDLLLGMSSNLLGLMDALRGTGFSGALSWIGSAMSYGTAGKTVQRSDDALRPTTFRGAVKAAESLLASQLAASCGIALTELRVFSAYGPYEQRGRLISRLLCAALGGERVPLAPRPSRRDWIHYEDVASACVASGTARLSGQHVFNVCSGELRDTHEIARLLEEITGKRLVAGHPYQADDPYGDALPGERPSVGGGLAWSPQLDLRQGLEQCWRWACSSEGRRYLLQDTLAAA